MKEEHSEGGILVQVHDLSSSKYGQNAHCRSISARLGTITHSQLTTAYRAYLIVIHVFTFLLCTLVITICKSPSACLLNRTKQNKFPYSKKESSIRKVRVQFAVLARCV